MSFLLSAYSYDARRRAATNEGSCISKKDLREMQGHYPPRCGSRDLRKRKAQAAPGLGESGSKRKIHGQFLFKVRSSQLKLHIFAGSKLRTKNYEL